MDLRLSTDLAAVRESTRALLQQHAGAARARAMRNAVDRELLDQLDEHGFLDLATSEGCSLVDAILLVEEAERAYARAPVAARAVVGALIAEVNGNVIGLAEPDRLVRYAGLCDSYLFMSGEQGYVCDAADAETSRIDSRWGYPLGYVRPIRCRELDPGTTAQLRRLWRIALAAEMGAQMQVAVQLSARYVTDRRQFGRPIGTYQAVSHQLATAHVYAEGATWLARRAGADPNDEVSAAVAATYACEAADVVIRATHQVTGAIGITEEYDLVLSTMRLGVLKLEFGGARAHARATARGHWPKLCAQPAQESGGQD